MKKSFILSAILWSQIGLCQNFYQGATTVAGDKEVYSVAKTSHGSYGEYIVRNVKNSVLGTPVCYADGTEVKNLTRLGAIPEEYDFKEAAEAVFTIYEIQKLKARKIGISIIVAVSPKTCRTLEMEFRIPNDSVICNIFTPKKLEQFERACIQNMRWIFPPNHPQVNYVWMSSGYFGSL